MKPGYNTTQELWDKVPDEVCRKTAEFMRPTMNHKWPVYFADVGERNKKIEMIQDIFNIKAYTLNANDFNFDNLNFIDSKFDIITCYEVLEHLTNPAFLLKNIVDRLKPNGVLFLSTPGRPKWMWSNDIHFHEIDDKRLKRWLFEPLGLEVVRQGKINMYYPRWRMWLGIRPMIRRFYCNTNIYELRLKR